MGIYVCMYLNTHIIHTYVVMDECMYVHMYVYLCIYAIQM